MTTFGTADLLTKGGLLRPAPEQNRLHGLEHYHRVEHEALVLDVVEIVLQLLPRVLDGRAVWVLDLRPPREARRYQVALVVERNLLGQLADEVRAFGPRADEVHLAAQDVPELRYLVHTNLAYHAPDARHARVAVLARPHGAVSFGVRPHRAELVDAKRASVLADALLRVEDGPRRVELNQYRRQQRQGQRQHASDERD